MHIPPHALTELEKCVGKHRVFTDDVSLLLNAYDCSLSRGRPDVLIQPEHTEQIAPILKILSHYQIPFTARAAATNHAGSCSALKGGAVINLARLNRILQIDTRHEYAWVEPGVITEQLQQELYPLGFFYAPDPASQRVSTLGGNYAQNASGARCLKYGGTLDHVLEVSFVLPSGETQQLSREHAGPDWVGLLSGSEGTLGIVSRLKVKILPLPAHLQTFLITFPSLEDCVQTVTDLIGQGILPRCVEAMDQVTLRAIEESSNAGYPQEAAALLLVELDGEMADITQNVVQLKEICQHNHSQQFTPAGNESERKRLWAGRQTAYSAMARLAPNVLVCDGTVPRSTLPATLRKVRQILTQNNIHASLLFHAGDGNFHPQIIFDERNRQEIPRVHAVVKQILQVCVDAGGTISGEHGVGVEKRSLMTYQYDKDTLHLLTRIKQAFDPAYLANPFKIIPLNFPERALPPDPLPAGVAQVAHTFTQFIAQQKHFYVTGRNTLLRTQALTCCTSGLDRILEIDVSNYTVTAQSAVTLGQLAHALHERGVYSVLPVSTHTLGGIFASGCFPTFYSHVTGIQALLPDGSFIRYGGKFTKNAAGYNLIRLFAGSQGGFGLITQLTFKIFAVEQTLLTPKPWQPLERNMLWKRLKHSLDPLNLLLTPPLEVIR